MDNAIRLDKFLVESGSVSGRDRVKELIAQGLVTVNGMPAKKAGQTVSAQDKIEVLSDERYVGRGGYKLEGAIQSFGISPKDKVCIDIGASTGGFTDCMLYHGAKKVYAIDVGTDQLAQKLRENSHVVSMEKTDIRHVTTEAFSEPITFFSVDVSFISLKQILPKLKELVAEHAVGVLLIKPQFEAGRKALNKKGIVRDEKIREEVKKDIISFAQSIGFENMGVCVSPITGGDGNIEYLLAIKKGE